ncbi:hypothetical protein [Brassicibacter mesophilus]|uniref:hypothetical protein n=1 Tax=Brassicibacter mesophilus TaxID=745119 RepID=UPI003D1E2327
MKLPILTVNPWNNGARKTRNGEGVVFIDVEVIRTLIICLTTITILIIITFTTGKLRIKGKYKQNTLEKEISFDIARQKKEKDV